jgi:hypothetical protein
VAARCGAAYSSSIDNVHRFNKDPIMNTQIAPRTTTRLASAAFAAVLTLAMLLGVNTLATHDTGAPQLAQAATATKG